MGKRKVRKKSSKQPLYVVLPTAQVSHCSVPNQAALFMWESAALPEHLRVDPQMLVSLCVYPPSRCCMSPSASGQESQLNTGSKVVLCPNRGFQQASTPPPCPKNGLCDQSSLTPTSNWPNCSPLPKIDRGLYLNIFQPFTSWHLINHLSSASRNTGPPHKDQTWGQSTLVPQPRQELQWTEYWGLQDTKLEEAWLHCSGDTVEMLLLRR